MLRRCLEATNIARSGCLFRWLIRAIKASVSVALRGEKLLDQLDQLIAAHELV